MRVITGSAKGFGLKAPKNMNLRPTPSMVKEAIFSSLGALIPNAEVLDLFAGTGAFSIECLSRGASSATLVEKDPRATKLIHENLEKTRLAEKARVLRVDVRQGLELLEREKGSYGIIFADPPYHEKIKYRPKDDPSVPKNHEVTWAQFLLQSSPLASIMKPTGILMVEHFKKEALPTSALFEWVRDFRFGDTVVALFNLKSPEKIENQPDA
jgi:16S rRNA (guanine966-N2)-methyltransferase